MLEARVVRGSLLKRIFDAIRELVPEVNFQCSATGIQIQALDTSHIALVGLDLKRDFFQEYKCDRDACLGLNMTAVGKVFRLCGNDDVVTIRHQDDSDTVSFVFEASNEDRVTDFDLKLMQIDQEHLGVPDSAASATLVMSSRQYAKICGDLGQFSDALSIECTSKAVRFSSQSDIGKGHITLKPGSDTDPIELHCSENVDLLFAVRYLNHFAKAHSLAMRVQLRLSSGQPLEVTLALDDNPDLGMLRFYLAPKLAGDESSQPDDEEMN